MPSAPGSGHRRGSTCEALPRPVRQWTRSNSGKTTVTAALARKYLTRGRRARVFKTGPDFLDPIILERASGALVYNLDLFPILAVIDSSAMAQTFGAVAHGLAGYRPDVPFAGVLANNVAGERHYEMLAGSLPPEITAFGWLARNERIALPSQHLGLIPAGEIGDFEARIQGAAAALKGFAEQAPKPIKLREPEPQSPARGLDGIRIAIARDRAFAFLYRANLELLRSLGAGLCFFSPLDESALPQADALYLPGGYPELHLDRLAANRPLKEAIREHHAAGRPILAECGGMLYLLESLTDARGHSAEMVGLLPRHARMQKRLANLGMHRVALPQGEIRGHTFHYSRLETAMEPVALSEGRRPGQGGEPVYREGALPVPRRNIADNVRAVVGALLDDTGLEVSISVPGGEAIAEKTLNPRLGILGGLSILGTSGIVHPYSTASFRATVVQGIRVSAAQGQDTVVLTTGRRTERFAMRQMPRLASVCFVQMGDFVRAALNTAVEAGIREIMIGGMVGKLTKMAQGFTMTHAGRGALDTGLLADLAGEIGAPREVRDDFGLRVLVCDPDGNKIAEAASGADR